MNSISQTIFTEWNHSLYPKRHVIFGDSNGFLLEICLHPGDVDYAGSRLIHSGPDSKTSHVQGSRITLQWMQGVSVLWRLCRLLSWTGKIPGIRLQGRKTASPNLHPWNRPKGSHSKTNSYKLYITEEAILIIQNNVQEVLLVPRNMPKKIRSILISSYKMHMAFISRAVLIHVDIYNGLIPPNVMLLTTTNSSTPYLLPSRPNPLCLTPPNLVICQWL